MFGSLVIAFPPQHEAGTLHLRRKDDVGVRLRYHTPQNDPSIAYIAFDSDIGRKLPVAAPGYRVTLTYNLYFDDTPTPVVNGGDIQQEVKLRQSLSASADNMEFLPGLGFGMQYQHPVKI